MNKAQETICAIAEHIPKTDTKELEFLRACYRVWNGYDAQSYSYPAHQLRGLEKRFGLTLNELKGKYRIRLK